MEEDSYEEIIAEEEPQQAAAGLVEFATDFVASYGWLLVLASAGAYVAWTRLLGPKFNEWSERRAEDERSARYHKDPDLALSRMQAMEAARARMQAQHDVAAAQHAQKLQEQEELKRQAKITDWENHQKGLGYRNKTRVEDQAEATPSVAAKAKPKAKLRNNDFNPLMGAGAGSCFRPNRRGGASGGG